MMIPCHCIIKQSNTISCLYSTCIRLQKYVIERRLCYEIDNIIQIIVNDRAIFFTSLEMNVLTCQSFVEIVNILLSYHFGWIYSLIDMWWDREGRMTKSRKCVAFQKCTPTHLWSKLINLWLRQRRTLGQNLYPCSYHTHCFHNRLWWKGFDHVFVSRVSKPPNHLRIPVNSYTTSTLE